MSTKEIEHVIDQVQIQMGRHARPYGSGRDRLAALADGVAIEVRKMLDHADRLVATDRVTDETTIRVAVATGLVKLLDKELDRMRDAMAQGDRRIIT